MYYQSKAEIEDSSARPASRPCSRRTAATFHEELVKILGRRASARATARTSSSTRSRSSTSPGSWRPSSAERADREQGGVAPRPRQGADARGRGRAPRSARLAVATATRGVVHAMKAPHYQVQPQTVEAVLLLRPTRLGVSSRCARGDPQHYINGSSRSSRLPPRKPGVERVLRSRREREIRVIVRPDERSTTTAGRLSLARDRPRDRGPARYPGQVKVTVIRGHRSRPTSPRTGWT